ncbi:hypothetical protein Droror1_Dr00018045, partial [Drosera rotundifolia]
MTFANLLDDSLHWELVGEGLWLGLELYQLWAGYKEGINGLRENEKEGLLWASV